MAEIINFNKARKARAKAEKQAEAAEKARIAKTLDDARRD